MAQSVRQRNLFAAEDFTVVYDSFKQANFKAYDYDSIRSAMVDYIRDNYPENFNDWISSSEFVALIELIAFMGHNIAFRTDLASRENFLSTAERRASVLRIADFLGYKPTRALPARGLLKISTIKTTQNVYDINGESLKNQEIDFNSDQDPNSYQNFLLVLNEILQSTNKFGRPKSSADISGVKTEVYGTNIADKSITFPFRGTVNGQSQDFEVVNNYINQDNILEEQSPNPGSSFNIIYRNDNQGIGSNNTGFFVGFKQGELKYTDYTADSAISNLSLSISSTNINELDVWVQNINENGSVIQNWTKVDTTFGVNAIFNSIQNRNRTLYSLRTLDNDNVSIEFGDGVFTDIPRGLLRIWYRESLNQSYTLNTDDIGTIQFNFKYSAKDGNEYQAVFSAQLMEPVANASSRESVLSVKTNAGRVFAAQDRMVTAEDYSIYPLTVSNNVRKIKSVNRTHSGHSRFIDINDPTAQYQNVNMIAEDGYIYSESVLNRVSCSLPTNLTEEQIFDVYIKELIQNPETLNFFYQNYSPVSVGFSSTTSSFTWNQVSKSTNESTGYLTRNGGVERVGPANATALKDVKVGSIIEFIESPYNNGTIGTVGSQLSIANGGSGYTSVPTITILGTGTGATASAVINNSGQITSVTVTNGGIGYTNPVIVQISGGGGSGANILATATSAGKEWARVVSVNEDGLGIDDVTGNPTGRDSKGKGAIVLSKVIPNSARITRIFQPYNTKFTTTEKTAAVAQLRLKNSFGLRFDANDSQWKVVLGNDLAPASTNDPVNWSTTYAGNSTSQNLDNSWIVRVNYTADKWEMITRRFRIVFGSDTAVRFYNQNNKIKFNLETNKPERDQIKLFKTNSRSGSSPYSLGKDINLFAYKYYAEPDGYSDDHKLIVTVSDINNDLYPDNPLAYKDLVGTDTVSLTTVTEDDFEYTVVDPDGTGGNISGRRELSFQWKRVADSEQRIDPAISNIIDTFVLSDTYDLLYRNWLTRDRKEDTEPKTPTSDELREQFQSLDNKRSISDSIIYRSARYKVLFGEAAENGLQAKFRVVKVKGTTLTDTEIKNRIITSIEEFFNVDNWDFGETFYFTELAAYVHNENLGIISSIVIVPVQENSAFGNLFQVTPNSDELFIPDVDLTSIDIVNNFTGVNLRTSIT
jgi:hypothetical protein